MDALDLDMFARLAVATLAGGVLGLNRELKHKPIGLRTLSIVSLACCTLTLASLRWGEQHGAAPETVGRAIQGLLAGIGFLGGGVIFRTKIDDVRGLTTAAIVWLTAALGVASGLGSYRLVGAAATLALLIVVLGGPLEKRLHRSEPDDRT